MKSQTKNASGSSNGIGDELFEDDPHDKPQTRRERNVATMWTCPLCEEVFVPLKNKPLNRQRNNHLRARHSEVELGDPRLHLRHRVAVVTATNQIPLEQRSWTCPFCDKGLPEMESRSSREKSINWHFQTEHKRRDTSLKGRVAARRRRLKLTKGTKAVGLPRPELGPKLKKAAALKRNVQVGNHDMVEVPINWDNWVGKVQMNPHNGKRANMTAFSCRKCRIFTRGLQKKQLEKSPCRGLRQPTPQKQRWWSQISADNKLFLATAWNCSVPMIEKWMYSAQSTKAPHSWQRNLVEEGMEPHPGPKSLGHFSVGSLNVQSPKGAWAVLEYLENFESPVALALQEEGWCGWLTKNFLLVKGKAKLEFSQ